MKFLGDGPDSLESPSQQSAKVAQQAWAGDTHAFKRRFMGARQNPAFIGHTGRKRSERDKVTAYFDHPLVLLDFLGNNVAKDAAFFLLVVISSGAQFIKHASRHERSRGQ